MDSNIEEVILDWTHRSIALITLAEIDMKYHCWLGANIALILSGCGGGSDGAAHVNTTPPVPLAPTPPPSKLSPVTTPTNENFDTSEYRNSRGAVASNAIGAWQQGATGQGIKIGFVDTGLNSSLSEFNGRIDPSSMDVAGTRPMGDGYGHGTAVASIAAAARDGAGMQGVAYEATIFMAKADTGCPASCSFNPIDIAEGIDAARIAGARVINLSIGGNSYSVVEDAIVRAAHAGLVIVISAGNSGNEPSAMARSIASRAPGQVIIVGALGLAGPDATQPVNFDLAGQYTSQAGSSQNIFIGAPGQFVQAVLETGQVDFMSGTSFAAPVVAGAAALLAQAFPNLSAQQIVSLLLNSADDLGIAGIDNVFGRGRINIGRAFQPVGTLMLAGTATIAPITPSSTLPRAAGDAITRGSLSAMSLDDYGRAYKVNLARAFYDQSVDKPLARSAVVGLRASELALGSIAVAMTVADNNYPFSNPARPLSLSAHQASTAKLVAVKALIKLTRNSSIVLGLDGNAASLDRRLSKAGTRAFEVNSNLGGSFGLNARNMRSLSYQYQAPFVAVSISGEVGTVWTMSRSASRAAYRAILADVELSIGRNRATIGASFLTEDMTVLGGQFTSQFGKSESRTIFASAEVERDFGNRWLASAKYQRGWTKFPTGAFGTSTFSLNLMKAGVLGIDDAVSFSVSQPVRIESGGFKISLPVAWSYKSQTAEYGLQRMFLSPTGREWAFETGYSHPLGGKPVGIVGLNLFTRLHPGHVRRADPDVGALLRISQKF